MDVDEPASDIAMLLSQAVDRARQALVEPGDWMTGAQRRAAWLECRDAATNELDRRRRDAISPNAVDGRHEPTDMLAAEAVEVLHRISSDPGRLSRSWAQSMMSEVGEERYVELVGIAALSAVVDTFDAALGNDLFEIADSVDGDPAEIRPDDVGDVGAWVSQTLEVANANVSRSLSLVPCTNQVWVGLVDALYSRGSGFGDLSWTRALSRPQVELVAARTTAELECFY